MSTREEMEMDARMDAAVDSVLDHVEAGRVTARRGGGWDVEIVVELEGEVVDGAVTLSASDCGPAALADDPHDWMSHTLAVTVLDIRDRVVRNGVEAAIEHEASLAVQGYPER